MDKEDIKIQDSLSKLRVPEVNVSKVKSAVMRDIKQGNYKNLGPSQGYKSGNGFWMVFGGFLAKPRFAVAMLLFMFTAYMGLKAYNSFETDRAGQFIAEYNQYLIEEDYYQFAEETLNQAATDELFNLYQEYEDSEALLQETEGV